MKDEFPHNLLFTAEDEVGDYNRVRLTACAVWGFMLLHDTTVLPLGSRASAVSGKPGKVRMDDIINSISVIRHMLESDIAKLVFPSMEGTVVTVSRRLLVTSLWLASQHGDGMNSELMTLAYVLNREGQEVTVPRSLASIVRSHLAELRIADTQEASQRTEAVIAWNAAIT